MALAHEELEAAGPPDALTVEDGTIRDPATGRSTDYWSLFGGHSFGRQVTGTVQELFGEILETDREGLPSMLAFVGRRG